MNEFVVNQYIKAQVKNNKEADISIFGSISNDDWWDEDVTPKKIKEMLNSFGDTKVINLHINSNGGSVPAGNTIISLLDAKRKKDNVEINAYIYWAASMATGIATVADKVYQYENAMQMIHKPWNYVAGNADDLRVYADELDKWEDTLVSNYMRKFKGTEDELRQLLSDETLLSAQECLDYGLCTEIIEPITVAACAKGVQVNNLVIEDNRYVQKIKNKFNLKESEENVDMKYSETLSQYGITEEVFKDIKDAGEIANMVSTKALADFKTKFADFMDENGEPKAVEPVTVTTNVIDTEILNAIGKEDASVEDVVAFVIDGKAFRERDTEVENKASQFDALFKNHVENALKQGVRAMGEKFNETSNTKWLNSLTYDEVTEISNQWHEQAKTALNAGKQVSVVDTSKLEETVDNLKDQGNYIR